jgi:hypothetical protein
MSMRRAAGPVGGRAGPVGGRAGPVGGRRGRLGGGRACGEGDDTLPGAGDGRDAQGRFRDVPAAGVTGLLVLLFGGDDFAAVSGGVSTPALMDGGAGDDHLNGGGGREVLTGGRGSDRLVCGGDDDILIAGTTAYDGNPAALDAVRAEWNRDLPFATRVAKADGGRGAGRGDQARGGDCLRRHGRRSAQWGRRVRLVPAERHGRPERGDGPGDGGPGDGGGGTMSAARREGRVRRRDGERARVGAGRGRGGLRGGQNGPAGAEWVGAGCTMGR